MAVRILKSWLDQRTIVDGPGHQTQRRSFCEQHAREGEGQRQVLGRYNNRRLDPIYNNQYWWGADGLARNADSRPGDGEY